MELASLAEAILNGQPITREQALAVMAVEESRLLELLEACFRVRKRYFGREVTLHVLRNAKSGVCPEDCSFCSQSLKADAGVDQYGIQTVEDLLEGARAAQAQGAARYCMVTATRGPSAMDLDTICTATRRIKEELQIDICASLGLLNSAQAQQLAAAGVDRFNHNLETSRSHFGEVVSTHSFEDRLDTVRAAKDAGMEACCGGIYGLGESEEDWVDLAFTLRSLEVESIPVNFLNARPGTPMEASGGPRPFEALKALALMRLVNPSRDVRVAGGREVVLRGMQALALFPANSLFVDGYLTTGGDGYERDLVMIEDAGFEVVAAHGAP